jgi:transposase
MAKPRSKPQLSLDMAHVCDDAEGIPDDHWSRLFFAHVYCAFDDADFAEMYEEGGRSPISPGFLAALTILQMMFDVSDRVAVEWTVMRRDWRIALGIGRDYTGFHATVLCRFRQRLVKEEEGKQSQQHGWTVFNTVLNQAKALNFMRSRTKLRVDATRLLANVSRLSRADAIQEAMRVVVRGLYDGYEELHGVEELVRLYDRYSEESWVGTGSNSEERLTELGQDGYCLLGLCGDREVKGQETLAQILTENFERSEEGESVEPLPQEGLAKDRILTPHEPDVESGKKGNEKWLGDKVHLVETAEKGKPNFVTDVLVTGPRQEDSSVVPEILERVRSGTPEAKTLLADAGYGSAEASVKAQEMGIDLVAPPRPSSSRGKIPVTEFEFDFERRVARCPQGHESMVWWQGEKTIKIRFPASICQACPRREECTTSSQGRMLHVGRHHQQLIRNRERAQTEEFRNLYKGRAAVEATVSELVRCCGFRRSRYRGKVFRELHAILCATALNVRRLLRALADPDRSTGSSDARSGAQADVRLCGIIGRLWMALVVRGRPHRRRPTTRVRAA